MEDVESTKKEDIQKKHKKKERKEMSEEKGDKDLEVVDIEQDEKLDYGEPQNQEDIEQELNIGKDDNLKESLKQRGYEEGTATEHGEIIDIDVIDIEKQANGEVLASPITDNSALQRKPKKKKKKHRKRR